jgi:hypothetical protein
MWRKFWLDGVFLTDASTLIEMCPELDGGCDVMFGFVENEPVFNLVDIALLFLEQMQV